VDSGQNLQVLIDHHVALSRTHPGEIRTPGHAVAHERRKLPDPPMHLRDRYPSAVQQILEPHLMAQRERQLGVDPIPPDQQPPGGPADGRIDEPVRTPAGL
jgi:hypothetical protein